MKNFQLQNGIKGKKQKNKKKAKNDRGGKEQKGREQSQFQLL